MSIYAPPTFSEYLPVFNPANWIPDLEGGLDIAYLNANYAQYPSIQGSNYTVQSLSIDGTLTLNEPNVERIILPNKTTEPDNGAQNNLVISENNNLAGCGNLANQNIVIGRNTLNSFTGTATNAFTNSTIIGHSALASCTISFANKDITAIGAESLKTLTNTTSSQFSAYNTGVGGSSLVQFLQGESNTSLGYRSGAGEYYDGIGPPTTIKPLFNGSNNTFVGARTGLDATLSNIVQHSTALGADALITASNQVVLGSATDTVLIPNTLSFANTSTSQKSASDNYTTFTYSTTLSLVDEVIVNTLVSLNPTVDNVNVNIADTANVDFNALSRVSFVNISNFNTTLRLINSAGNLSSTSTFTGLYGSQLNTIILRAKTQINVFINTTAIGTFVVQDRMPEIIGTTIPYSGSLISLTSPQYFESRITLTGTVATTVSLPDPRTSVNSFSNGRSITLINEGSGLLSISSTNGNFGGNHGNTGATIFLPDNVSYTFTSNGTIWEINERSDNITYQNLNVNLASTVSYSGNYNYLGATLNISSTVAGDVIYPAPSDSQSHLTTSIIRNVGIYTINILISTGEFSGKYGKGLISTTYPLPPNSWVKIFSDGTNYRVDERSETTATILMPSDAFSIATCNYFTDCRLNVSPFSDANILTISSPVNIETQYYNIFNQGQNFTLTLRSVGFDFGYSAKYSNDSNFGNDLTIPPNTWVKLYSEGSLWKVVDKSSDNQIYNYSPAVSFSQNGNLLNNSTTYITPSATGVTYSLITPATNFCKGAYQIIYNKSGINTLTLNTEGLVFFLGIYGSGTSTLIVPPSSWVKLISNGVNWLVDDRSSNFNLFLLANGTTIDLTSNLQYLDTTLEFVPPDAPTTLITRTTFSGASCTQSAGSYNITITSTVASGRIGVGSVIIPTGFARRYITGQVSGTAGAGSGAVYSTSVKASSLINAVGFSGFAGTGTTTSGTITTFSKAQSTNYPVATLSVTTLTAGSSFTRNTANILTPNYIYTNLTGGVYQMTSGTREDFISGGFFTTSGTIVQLPTASNVRGRSINVVNSGYTAIMITTSAGTSLFTGTYGQFDGDTLAFPNKYLLKPSETVILMSDGTNWETQSGTSLGGARIWSVDIPLETPTADFVPSITASNVATITNYVVSETLTQSNLSGLIASGSTFINTYPFPITINIAPNMLWSIPASVPANTSSVAYGEKPPQRYLEIRQVSTKAGGNYPSNTGLSLVVNIPCTATPQTLPTPAYSKIQFVPSPNFFWQSLNGLFTLQTGDTLTMKVGKVSGVVSAEQVEGLTVYINRVA